MYEKSVTYQFVGNVVNGVSTGDLVTTLPEGAVAVIDAAGKAVNPGVAVSATTPIRIATRVNGVLKQSPLFTKEKASMSVVDYAAAVEQVSFIGYNGTEGELDTTIDATYIASVDLQHTQGIYNNTPVSKTVGAYLPDNTAFFETALGQYEHATRLLNAFNKSFAESRLGGNMIKVERVNSGNNTDVPTGVDNVVFTKGSTLISATDIDNAIGTAALAVGELIRVGTSLTSPVYKIVSIDTVANTAVIDSPFAGETVTLLDTEIQRVTVANQGNANWGVKLTGVTKSTFNPKTDMWPRMVRFNVSYTKSYTDPLNLNKKVNEAATAKFTTTVAASEGSGTFAEIAKEELRANMNEGNYVVSAFPPTNYIQAANASNGYDQIVIKAIDNSYTEVATGIQPVSTFVIKIAIEDSLALDNLDTVLGVS